MRRLLFLSFIVLAFEATAQTSQKPISLGAGITVLDPSASFTNGNWLVFDSSLSTSFRLEYARYLTRVWEVSAGMSHGMLRYPQLEEGTADKTYVFGLDARILYKFNNGRIVREDARLKPYFGFGYDLNWVADTKTSDRQFNLTNEYIVGINFSLNDECILQLETALDQQLGGSFYTAAQHRLGIRWQFERPDPADMPVLSEEEQIDLEFEQDSLERVMIEMQREMEAMERGEEEAEENPFVVITEDEEEMVADVTEDSAANNRTGVKEDADTLVQKEENRSDREEEIQTEDQPQIEIKEVIQRNAQGYPIGYYAVVATARDPKLAEAIKKKAISKSYEEVHVMAKPNDYYRVSIFVGSDENQAKQKLKEIRDDGFLMAWLSYEN